MNIKKLWRPVGASVALFCMALRYLGLVDPNIPPDIELKILTTFQLLVGVYAAGRSGEKIAEIIQPVLNRGE